HDGRDLLDVIRDGSETATRCRRPARDAVFKVHARRSGFDERADCRRGLVRAAVSSFPIRIHRDRDGAGDFFRRRARLLAREHLAVRLAKDRSNRRAAALNSLETQTLEENGGERVPSARHDEYLGREDKFLQAAGLLVRGGDYVVW